jgi:exopolysaccharide biosynthesis polyprenyl glycosylphosphotransferase
MSASGRNGIGACTRPLQPSRFWFGPPRAVLRHLLMTADVVGLCVAFLAADALLGGGTSDGMDRLGASAEFFVFLATLPAWVLVANIHGLYSLDEKRTDHSIADEIVRVFQLVTLGTWLFALGSRLLALAEPSLWRMALFWGVAIVAIATARTAARTAARRTASFGQKAVIVGAGSVGQLVARKLLQHPEYGIRLVGFVDTEPLGGEQTAGAPLLGRPEELAAIVTEHRVDRVILAFTKEPHERMLELVRTLRPLEVQIDIVPRLFEVIGPQVDIHYAEGVPLLGIRSPRMRAGNRLIKRSIDVVGAALALLLALPACIVIAVCVKLDSPGPVLFRQTRLGEGMREFTSLKFRTMTVETSPDAHRDYIATTMAADAAPHRNGLFKLERSQEVTRAGRLLRKTSLDELPQLVNVLRGEMSLVGPRPCIPYETAFFAEHHFERFLVPAGLTGLWQVTARANASFREALEMDVAYVRGYSLGLDLRLLLRTPVQVFRQQRSTA